MVDMVKKVHKKGSQFLQPEEQVLGASVVNGVGQFKKTVAFGAIGGVVGMAVGQAVKGKSDTPTEGSMAESLPSTKQAILAVSNQRWILFEQSAMSGAPKGVAASWGHDDLAAIDLEPGKVLTKINLTFSDGSTAQMEAVRAAKPDKLAEAAASLR